MRQRSAFQEAGGVCPFFESATTDPQAVSHLSKGDSFGSSSFVNINRLFIVNMYIYLFTMPLLPALWPNGQPLERRNIRGHAHPQVL